MCETYNISEQQANDYYHDALYKIQQAHSADEDAVTIREQQIERIESMLEDALKSNDKRTATKCQEMLNKIYQLYVEKKEVDVSLKNLEFKFGDE